MSIESKCRRWVTWASAVLLFLFVHGCSGVAPYQPRNNREEGPQSGIFTGYKGEFIFPMPDEPVKENKSAK
jgi:hypothetical protein